MTRARDLANIADGTFTATDLDLSGTLTVSGDANFDSGSLFVDVSANAVGIGSTSPVGRLDVSGGADGTIGSITLAQGNTTSKLAKIYGTSVNTNEKGIRFNTFHYGDVDAVTITSDGNVGIGTTSPASLLTIQAASPTFEIDSTTSSSLATLQFTTGGIVDSKITHQANSGTLTIDSGRNASWNGNIAFVTDTAEAMRIDSSGNLLVGKTSNTFATAGTAILGGEIQVTRAGVPMYLRRNSSDGDILVFYKDGTTVGSIASEGADLVIGTGNAGLRFFDQSNAIIPRVAGGGGSDGTISLGQSAQRFKDLYRSGSTISTSDRNAKQDERPLTEAEANVAQACKGLLKAFRFIDAVETDGDGARIHFGIIAQDLQAAFEAEGLDATRYAMFRPSTFTDDEGNEQTRLGVCYENLLAFIIAAL